MAASYAHVNYALRPAKHIERRMVFEALRRLDRLGNVGDYRYVGFASPFFVDFRLAHRELAVERMTNIESEITDQARFEFNRPFGFIDLKWGESVAVLEELEWSERAIVWLDFDKPLAHQQISAIQIAIGLLPAGSVLIVTTNAEPERPLDGRIQRMQTALADYMPFDLTNPDLLGGWSTADLYHSIITDVIDRELEIRNEGASVQTRLGYQQWFNFHYRDSTRMLTTGGIIVDGELKAKVDGVEISDFAFTRSNEDAYEIDPPILTLREMAHLESQFPCSPDQAGLAFLADKAIARHQELYRYCPRFADVDI